MRRMFCFHKSNSGEIARSRLKLVLVSDQSGCSPGLIDGIREEMIRILSRHVEIDSKRIDIRLAQMSLLPPVRLLWKIGFLSTNQLLLLYAFWTPFLHGFFA